MGTLFLIGLGLMIAGFALVWAVSVWVKNYSFLDVAWSYGLVILAPLYIAFGPGSILRKELLAVLGVAWSLRLGTHILVRVLKHHPKEDVRYEKLRKQWPGPWRFLLFFEIQAVLIAVLSVPFLLVSFNTAPGLKPIEIAGLILGLIALCGETLSDLQMARFKANRANHGKVCQEGLWRYSRHPNYFFEALIWVAFFIVALGTPWGWVTFYCPLLMLYFLLKITGIPLTEQYSVQSKGEAYRAYQRTTSAFVPWFPKKG